MDDCAACGSFCSKRVYLCGHYVLVVQGRSLCGLVCDFSAGVLGTSGSVGWPDHLIAKIRAMLLATDPQGFAGSYAAVCDMDMRRTIALIASPMV
jgi:hypothetical protein